MNDVIHTVKGTHDYYPEDMALRNWLYQQMRAVSEAFGYQEYDGPFLEAFDLYAAKSSEEIVEKQAYVFEDRGGDKITLRPELTPSLARMVAQRQPQLYFPLRWWSFGPFWRYERPQKGRTREFFQWNIDLIGDSSPEADAELAAIAATFLKQVGLKPEEVKILVNNRGLMDEQTLALGIQPEMRLPIYRLIDRREKMKAKQWEAYAAEVGLSKGQLDGLVGLIEDKALWEQSPELVRFFEAVAAYGVEDYMEFAPQIIRGFDYYTGTVFEAWDTAGEFRSLFGGGRYDDLVSDVGGEPVPAVGFAVGNMVIELLLKELGRVPAEVAASPVDVYVAIFDSERHLPALALSQELRQAGLRVASHPVAVKLGKQFKYADRIGARFVLVLGPDELKAGEVTLKDLRTGEQSRLPRQAVAEHIRQQLVAGNAS